MNSTYINNNKPFLIKLWHCCLMLCLATGLTAQPQSLCSTVQNIGSSQTVVIPSSPQISGADLQNGAYIIIGYEDNGGVFHCVNHVEWNGNLTSVAAYIDGAGGSKDGFEAGDEIIYQIELPDGTILDNLVATYEDVNLTIATAVGTITAKDALSVVKSLGTVVASDPMPDSCEEPILVGVPANVTVECGDEPVPPNVTAVGGYEVIYNERRLGANCDYVLSRTWTVSNDCGKTTSKERLVVVSDKTAPTLVGVPEDITVNINLGETLPIFNVTAIDDCDPEPQIITALPGVIIDPCSNQVQYSQFWFAVDRCTNESLTQSYTITIIDDNLFEDADGDGVCDLQDKCEGYDDSADADGDGIPDGCEQCDGSLKITLSESYDATCNGGNDGKLVIDITGAIGTPTILWSNNVTSPINDGLVVGDYTVNIKDDNNCSATETITVGEPAVVKVTGVVINQDCNVGTGSIDISVEGGTAPYTYGWDSGVTSEDRSGLDAGTYNLIVTDAKGCSTERQIYTVVKDCGCDNITAGGKIGFDDDCTASISICGLPNTTIIENCETPSGGSGDLQYIWLKATTQPVNPPSSLTNDPAWMIVPLSNTPNLAVNDLSQTTWFIRCVRRAGCDDYIVESNIVRVRITTKAPGTVCIDGDPTTENDMIQMDGCTCKGTTTLVGCPDNVQITPTIGKITITGLTAPISKVTIFDNAQNTVYHCNNCPEMVMKDLPAGDYRIFIQFGDASGSPIPNCIIFDHYTVPEKCEDGDKDGVCKDQDCDDTNPNLPATPGASCSDGDDNTINDAIQSDGCTCKGDPILTCEIIVTVLNKINPTCHDKQDGIIMVMASNGTGPYTYKWSNGVEGINGITELGAGEYTVSITDDTGCIVEKSYTLVAPEELSVAITIQDATCGEANGTATISASGGTPNYKYFIGAAEVTSDLDGLAPGDYTVKVRDEESCEISVNFTIGDNTSDCGNVSTCDDVVIINTNGNIKITIGDGNNYRYVIHERPAWGVVRDEITGDMYSTTLNEGEYVIRIYVIGEWITPFCETKIIIGSTACDDADGDNICDADDCAPNNPDLPAQTADIICDDDDVTTENDVYLQGTCDCKGTLIGGGDPAVCEVDITQSGLSVTVSGTDEEFTKIEVFRGIFGERVHFCDYYDDCPESKTIGNLQPGTYTIKVQSFQVVNNRWLVVCDVLQYITIRDDEGCRDDDDDGVCADQDCDDTNPNVPATIGSTCDDGNANTTGDVIQSDGCACVGIPVVSTGPDCDAVYATVGNGSITVHQLTSPIEHVKLYVLGMDERQTQVNSCAGDCGDSWTADGLPAGNYLIQFTLRDANWGSICVDGEQDLEIYVTLENGVASGRGSDNETIIIPTDFKVYPNPAQEEAWITLSDWNGQNVELSIYNHFSQTVYERNIEKVSDAPERIGLESFMNGLYYIQIQTEGKQPIVRKLLVSRRY